MNLLSVSFKCQFNHYNKPLKVLERELNSKAMKYSHFELLTLVIDKINASNKRLNVENDCGVYSNNYGMILQVNNGLGGGTSLSQAT